ncbi:hypothetical protein [Streptomyces rubiginosohelvolus]|uniref:hypothetical protein n=1 Tax=Streptomyces rubiginosohelvolus TaxID=67362 RepID=UPI00371176FE
MATSPLRHDGLVGRWSSLLPGSCGLEPNRPYGTELFALDVVAVLDYLGVHRADVYGSPRADAWPSNSQPATRTWCALWDSAARHPVDRTASNATAS